MLALPRTAFRSSLRSVGVRNGYSAFVPSIRLFNSADASPSATQTTKSVNRPINRPMSPHVTIYQPQLTWTMSIANRITGAGLSGLLYLSGCYLLAGHSAHDLVNLVAAMPAPFFVTAKAFAAFPFTYHTFNGIRHLVWDAGYALSLKGVYMSGYATLGATAVTTLALCAM